MPDMKERDGALDAMIALHTRSLDTEQGFAKMVEKAEPAFRPIAQRFGDLHARHVTRLGAMVRELGGEPDADGSFMGTVNRAVVTLRSVFDQIDDDVMVQVRNGEDFVLTSFDGAIAERQSPEHHRALVEMRAELAALLDETRHVK